MELDRISIPASPGRHESLVVALQAVAAAEAELDYDELCGALGVSFAAVATPADGDPAAWRGHGRDAFLVPTARLFGIELRDLHPRDVGVEMLRAEQFPLHFDDSYRPLIERALANGQPVLAWQGWPEPRQASWGVITGSGADGLSGVVPGAGEGTLPLVGPAMQCYVVERCEPQRPPEHALLAMVVRHADAYLANAAVDPSGRASGPEIVTGPRAFEAWAKWIEGRETLSEPAELGCESYWRYADFVAAGRQSAARCLSGLRQAGDKVLAEWIDDAVSCCGWIATLLAESRDAENVRSAWATPAGRRQMLGVVGGVGNLERSLASLMHNMM